MAAAKSSDSSSRLYTRLSLLLVLLGVALSAFYFSPLPERVPVHWNGEGSPDRWATRAFATVFIPSVMVVLAFGFGFLPRIATSDSRNGPLRFASALLGSVALCLCLVLHWLLLKSAAAGELVGAQWADLVLAPLLVAVGVSLKRVPRNYFFGIRNPWTLRDPEIWTRANGLGAWTLSLAGIAVAAIGITAPCRSVAVPIGLAFAAAGIPTAYSLLLWKGKRRGTVE